MKASYEKKGELRIHQVLSNGQVASFYATFVNEGNGRVVEVGYCIGKHRKWNNYWWSGRSKKVDNKSTGKCGMEGLMFALQCIRFVHEEYMGNEDVMIVGASDMKRHSAYRRLEKYGFVSMEDGTYALLHGCFKEGRAAQ